MSNDVNTNKFYLFLAQYQAEGKTWSDIADDQYGNDDGIVIKSEFRSFLNAEWNGEENGELTNDLINSFWKKIDTNTSASKISGSRLKNLNALDKKELEAMNSNLEVYVAFNKYITSLAAPSVVSDANNWKKSVSQGLEALVAAYVENGGTAAGLSAFLDAHVEQVKAKATADYCAQEYLAEVMGDVAKEYGYTYGDDATLNSMINRYIQSLPENITPEEIQQTVHAIIDSYLATAGLGEGAVGDLTTYGYSADANAPMNDLQKSIIKSKLLKALTSGELAERYEEYKTAYDEAIDKYMGSLKFADFETISADVISAFTSSDVYKDINNVIDTKAVFNSDELKTAIATAIGESFANRLTGLMKGEIPFYDSLVEQAMAKTQNGDFTNADGTLDTQKLIDWVVGEMKSNLAEFYPNGFSDMPIKELNLMYDTIVASAKENQDAAKIKEMTISYCKVISSKGDNYAKAVTSAFGTSDYAAAINKMLTSEIEEKMNILRAKLEEIDDLSNLEISSWSGISDNLQMDSGKSQSYAISAAIKNKDGKSIDASRIQYTVTGSVATVNNGTITVTAPSQPGYYSFEIQATVDGQPVGSPKEIKLTVKQSPADTAAAVKSWDGEVSEHLETYGVNDGKQITDSNFADLYNKDAIIRLDNSESKKDRSEWNKGRSGVVKERLLQLGNLIVSALSTAGLDKSKLQTAMKTVTNDYAARGPKDYWEDHHDITNNTVKKMNNERNTYSHTIVAGYDDDGNTEASYMIRFKDLVDDILAEYWKLVG